MLLLNPEILVFEEMNRIADQLEGSVPRMLII